MLEKNVASNLRCKIFKGSASGLVIKGGDQKVVSLNPGAGYCRDICHINLLHKCNV